MGSQLCTKTAILLKCILPNEESTVRTFDKCRWQLKHSSIHNMSLENDYMDLIARIEVKVITKEMDLKDELRILEKEQWDKDKGLSLSPKTADERKYYEDILSDLKRINLLRNELKI